MLELDEHTIEDRNNAIRYALSFSDCIQYTIALHYYPHIISFINVTKLETQDGTSGVSSEIDFFIPDSLKKHCEFSYMFQLTRTCCDKLGCNLYYPPNQSCLKETTTQIYRTGRNFLLACQPACHNLMSEKVMVHDYYWNEGKNRCVLSNIYKKRFATLPVARSESAVPGLTDVVPFDWDEPNDTYHFNREYCKRFGRKFDQAKKSCYETIPEKVTKFFVAHQTRKLMWRVAETLDKFTLFKMAKFLDEVATTLKPEPSSKPLPNIEIPFHLRNAENWREHTGNVKNTIVFPFKETLINLIAENSKIARNEPERERVEDERKTRKKRSVNHNESDTDPADDGESKFDPESLVGDILDTLNEDIIIRFVGEYAAHKFTQGALRRFKVFLKHTILTIIRQGFFKATKIFIGQRINVKIFKYTIENAIIHAALNRLALSAESLTASLAKISKTAIRAANWAMAILNVIDLIVTVVDPLGYNNYLSPETRRVVDSLLNEEFHAALGIPLDRPEALVLDAKSLFNMLLYANGNNELQVSFFKLESAIFMANTYKYLSELKYNSRGQRIGPLEDDRNSVSFDEASYRHLKTNAKASSASRLRILQERAMKEELSKSYDKTRHYTLKLSMLLVMIVLAYMIDRKLFVVFSLILTLCYSWMLSKIFLNFTKEINL